MPLDFVVAGIQGCGTTTVWRTLQGHRDVGFTDNGEDPALYSWYLAPPAALIRDLAARRRAAGEPRAFGLANPMMWSSFSVFEILKYVAGLKVVVMVCDPVRVFEKFWVSGNNTVQDDFEATLSLAKATISGRDALFATELLKLRKVFGDRLTVVHQSHLREEPREAFKWITRRLGIEDLPAGHTFHRYNVHDRVGTFCSNRTLVRRLQRLFYHDYVVTKKLISDAGLALFSDVVNHMSYCDTSSWATGQ